MDSGSGGFTEVNALCSWEDSAKEHFSIECRKT